MNEYKEMINTKTNVFVISFLDEVVDRVVAHFNRIERLRILTQPVLDDITTGTHNKESDADDVENIVERRHSPDILRNAQHWPIYDGQINGNAVEQVFENSKRSRPNSSISRHQNMHPKCCRSNKIEPADSKQRANSKSLSTGHSSRVPSLSSSLTSCHDDKESTETNDNDVSSVNEEIKYPKYEIVKTVKTCLGHIKIYCNGEIDQEEIDRIIMESKRILYTRKKENTNNKDGECKKNGLFSRVRKFFRRMSCCCCSVLDEG